MTFELATMTKARVLDVRTLASKDRKPDELPGAQMLFAATMSCELLAMFDGFLPGYLYRQSNDKAQGELKGIEGKELTSIGSHVKRMPWEYEQTGCTIEIDRGLGGRRSNLLLSDCKVHRVSFAPQQGGSVKVQWTLDAPAQTDEARGKLSGLKATDIELTLIPPSASEGDGDGDGQQQLDDGAGKAPAAGRKKAAEKGATDEFLERNGAGAPAATH